MDGRLLQHNRALFSIIEAPSPDMSGEPCMIAGVYKYVEAASEWIWEKAP
jgi:hypothetical protein